MLQPFDTLTFAMRLTTAGLDREIADALAFAVRDVLLEQRMDLSPPLSSPRRVKRLWSAQ